MYFYLTEMSFKQDGCFVQLAWPSLTLPSVKWVPCGTHVSGYCALNSVSGIWASIYNSVIHA